MSSTRAQRTAVRRQLEGAYEVLESAAQRYRTAIRQLDDPHWATPIALRSPLLRAASEMEAPLAQALEAARRRRSRGDLAGDELELADAVSALRLQLDQLLAGRAGAGQKEALEVLVARVERLCQNVVTRAKAPWWDSSESRLELSLPMPPEAFLTALLKAVVPAQLVLGEDPSEELQDFRATSDGRRFEVWTPPRKDGTGRLCAWSGKIRRTEHGCVIRSRVGFSWRLGGWRAVVAWGLPVASSAILHAWTETPGGLFLLATALALALGNAVRFNVRVAKDGRRLEAFATRTARALGAKDVSVEP